jgi:glycerophosphoryl diester phosphodiesterase
MELMDRRVPLNIELKGANTAGRVNSIIGYFIRHKQWKLQDFVISSFNWEELRQMRIYNPDIAIAVLTEGEPLEALPIAQELGAVAVNPYFENLSAQTVELLHKEGFKVYTWTVNKEEDIERMREYAVDGIFTNYPERVR